MWKILKYSFNDLVRSRWMYIYTAFYLLFTVGLLLLSNDLSKVIISLMNVILVLVPLIASMFGIMYYYSSREFIELLLAQPIRRSAIFLGQYLGIATSLSISLLIGVGIPFVIFGIFYSPQIWHFMTLVWVGVILTFIFSAIAFLIAIRNENRIRGFGMVILAWLFLAVIYDGIFLILLSAFNDYPLESFALFAAMANPIDLSRILILLELDISALMGYTGAVFQKFLGSGFGMLAAISILLVWIATMTLGIKRSAAKKDF